MISARQLISEATRQLQTAGIEAPQLDAQVLTAHVLGLSRGDLLLKEAFEIQKEQVSEFEGLLARRMRYEPIARIIGHKEFWSLDFEVNADTLVPRPDSETLVEAVVRTHRGKAVRILDLGTGSGCLLLATLSELEQAEGMGLDISRGAVETARRNADKLGLASRADFSVGDYMEPDPEFVLNARPDILISNPPYIVRTELEVLDAEVRDYDPHGALDGGDDGLDHYRRLVVLGREILSPQGEIYLEVGFDQAEAVASMLTVNGWDNIMFYKDLAGIDRCIGACAAGL